MGPHERHAGRDGDEIFLNFIIGMFTIIIVVGLVVFVVSAGWWTLAVVGFCIASYFVGVLVRWGERMGR